MLRTDRGVATTAATARVEGLQVTGAIVKRILKEMPGGFRLPPVVMSVVFPPGGRRFASSTLGIFAYDTALLSASFDEHIEARHQIFGVERVDREVVLFNRGRIHGYQVKLSLLKDFTK